jgi:hypothetical protein
MICEPQTLVANNAMGNAMLRQRYLSESLSASNKHVDGMQFARLSPTPHNLNQANAPALVGEAVVSASRRTMMQILGLMAL